MREFAHIDRCFGFSPSNVDASDQRTGGSVADRLLDGALLGTFKPGHFDECILRLIGESPENTR